VSGTSCTVAYLVWFFMQIPKMAEFFAVAIHLNLAQVRRTEGGHHELLQVRD
jgi:hypothetical protein